MVDPMIPADTSKEAYRVQTDIYRRMPLERKLRLVFDMCAMGRMLVKAGLRMRYPQASEQEIHRLGARQHLGDELFEKVCGQPNVSTET